MQIQCKACGHNWSDPHAGRKLVLECPNCHAPNPVPGASGDADQQTVITGSAEATHIIGDQEQTLLTGGGAEAEFDPDATQHLDPNYEPFKDSLVQKMMKAPGPEGPKTRPTIPAGMAPVPPMASRMAMIPPTNPPAPAHVPRPLDETENTVPAAPPPSRTPKLADETQNTVVAAPPSSGVRGPRPTEDTEGATIPGTSPPPSRPRQAPTPAPSAPASQQHSGQSTTSKERNRKLDSLIGRPVGGYVFKKKLGQGGMGAVYLARQLSLDRDVAVKVLPEDLATNGDFLARFTREALTAAQLNHHNVVQVYDVGYDAGVHYICMEFVKGASLGDVIRKDGKLPIDDAAGYLLQAARGLQYSHDRGIIHRDIKPDNIMVNEHGIVKIADMGLAKVAGHWERGVGMDHNAEDAPINPAMADLTQDDVAMGTPAYMAPEQGRDASKVDHRADQYSLGCTLYYMCAGKTPFSGKTTFEIISKHATEPLVPLEAHVKGVPRELSLIIEKMLAKTPEERFPSMKEVIGALETYLDVDSGKGPYSPREQHVSLLERELAAYYGVGAIKTRFLAKAGFFAASLLLLTIFALMKNAFLASAMLGLMVMAPLFQFILDGVMQKTFLFRRTRAVFFGMTLKGWLATGVWTLVALAVMYLFGLIVPWIVVAVLAAGAAAAYQFVVLKKLREERATQLYNVQEMLKGLRLRGVSEDAIQDFVCRFSGVQWEEFFEDLFGYEAMIIYRGRYAKKDAAHPRKKHATWREPIVRWLEEIEDTRRKEKEKRELARAEKARLKSTGVDDATAGKQAEQIASKAVDQGELMPTVIVAAAPSKKEIAQLDKELHSSGKKSRGSLSLGNAFNFLRWMRLAMGLMMILGFATRFPAVKGKIPAFAMGWFEKVFLNHGLVGANVKNVDVYLLIVAIAGILMVLSALSRQLIFPAVMLAGAIISSYFLPILALSGAGIGGPVALWAGLAMVAAGFFFMVAARKK